MFTDASREQAESLLSACRSKNVRLATAESCTGGLIAALLTDIAGSSAVFERGFVTYSNEAKCEALGMDKGLIAAHGAVSAEVAAAMARGALAHSHADMALSVTGIAGPGGGTADKPVGLVYIAVATKHSCDIHTFHFMGDRNSIRCQAVEQALVLLKSQVSEHTLLA